MSGGLEREIDELYALAPAAFTARRDALVKAHKAQGDKETAKALAARRRPTQTAWILNQLARRHADDVAAFVDAGRALLRVQRKALRGEDASELRAALSTQRELLTALKERADDVVADLGLDAAEHAGDLSRALQAALTDPAAAAALEEGRLEKAPEAANAWSDVGDSGGAVGDDVDVGSPPKRSTKAETAETAEKAETPAKGTTKKKAKPKKLPRLIVSPEPAADAEPEEEAQLIESARRRPRAAVERKAVHKAAAKQRVRETRRRHRDDAKAAREEQQRLIREQREERARLAREADAAREEAARASAAAAERRAREEAVAIVEAAAAEAAVREQEAADARRLAEEQQAAATSLAERLEALRAELKRVEREADELRFAAAQAATIAKKAAAASAQARARSDRLARREAHEERS